MIYLKLGKFLIIPNIFNYLLLILHTFYNHYISVSSSLMQRFLNHILTAALDLNVTLRTIAFDVIGNVVRQGLAHPTMVNIIMY